MVVGGGGGRLWPRMVSTPAPTPWDFPDQRKFPGWAVQLGGSMIHWGYGQFSWGSVFYCSLGDVGSSVVWLYDSLGVVVPEMRPTAFC